MGVNHREHMTVRIKDERREKGFTLLEILIAITILMVGILAVAAMETTAIRGNSFSRDTTEATTWAKDKVEHLMSLPYDDVSLTDQDDDADPTDLNQVGAGIADYGPETPASPYSLYWNVCRDWPISNTKTIRVIVTWQDRGATRRVTLTNIKSQL